MTPPIREVMDEKQYRASLLKKKIEIQSTLPHLYGWKHYKWSRAFEESTNKYNFLCAANQIGKSSSQIRKCIRWATEPALWPKLWKTVPRQFWYLYPSKELATAEYRTKWITELLPQGDYKASNEYGWEAEIRNRLIQSIRFNTGVIVFFKTYAQEPEQLQGGSCHSIFLDEEPDAGIFDELNMRIAGVDGYFHMVFTATLGQEFWRQTIEERGTPAERFPTAFKQQVTMYDCLQYEDGTPSHWTTERIKLIEASCKSQAEVQRRVYGRFVIDEGLAYPSFTRAKNMLPHHPLPSDWRIYAGVDPGGGGNGHPASICFVSVNPDFTKGRVIKTWRGDGITTTASDILTKFQMMKEKMILTGQYYDWACKDFGTIATRAGEPFQPADKSREIGEQMLNTLFKNEMLCIYETSENEKLAQELCSLKIGARKQTARDDLVDALRYSVSKIPWNWAAAFPETTKPEVLRAKTEEEERRAFMVAENESILNDSIEQEFDEWNEAYGGF